MISQLRLFILLKNFFLHVFLLVVLLLTRANLLLHHHSQAVPVNFND